MPKHSWFVAAAAAALSALFTKNDTSVATQGNPLSRLPFRCLGEAEKCFSASSFPQLDYELDTASAPSSNTTTVCHLLLGRVKFRQPVSSRRGGSLQDINSNIVFIHFVRECSSHCRHEATRANDDAAQPGSTAKQPPSIQAVGVIIQHRVQSSQQNTTFSQCKNRSPSRMRVLADGMAVKEARSDRIGWESHQTCEIPREETTCPRFAAKTSAK